MSVRNCGSCGRPNGVNNASCMYCGTLLPPSPDLAEPHPAVEPAVAPDRARELLAGLTPQARSMMPADVLARLQAAADSEPVEDAPAQAPVKAPVVRSRLGFTGLGRRGTTSASLPAVQGPAPTAPADISNAAYAPPTATEDDSIEPLPTDRLRVLEPPPPDADLPEDPPTLERLKAVDEASLLALSTAAIRPLDTGEMEALPLDAVSSYWELEAIDPLEPFSEPGVPVPAPFGGPLTDALGRGGGPFGPRDAAWRLILLPSEDYKSKLQWMRHRLADTTGIDLYTAAQTLSKDVPSFLSTCDELADAEERAGHLRQGGMEVLVLGRDRTQDIEPIRATSASGDWPGAVRFETAEGAVIEVKREGFAWGCMGEIEPDGDRATAVPQRTLRGRNLPERPGFDAQGGPYLLLDLFLTRATQPIRLRSDRFDFACLGDDRELAATLNMRKMLGWLSAHPARPLPLDERFRRLPRLRVSAHRGEVDGKLVLPQREVEFTEYGLITNAHQRGVATV